jgi:hypothetical protein
MSPETQEGHAQCRAGPGELAKPPLAAHMSPWVGLGAEAGVAAARGDARLGANPLTAAADFLSLVPRVRAQPGPSAAELSPLARPPAPLPPPQRSNATSSAFGGLHLGTVLGLMAAPPIVDALGWRALFYIYGGLGGPGRGRAWLRRSPTEVECHRGSLCSHGQQPSPSTSAEPDRRQRSWHGSGSSMARLGL